MTPSGKLVVVNTSGAAMRISRFAIAVLGVGVAESVAVAVKKKFPAEVGVPEIAPVEGVKLNPFGKVPELTLQVRGPVPSMAVRLAE